ncbi:MAG: SGNH/GDSL hydrolase family protein [Nitrospirota bacterium]
MKRLIQNLLLILSGSLIGLLLIEIILSLLDIPVFHNAHNTFPSQQFLFRMLENGKYYYTYIPSSNIKFIYDSNPRGYFDSKNVVTHKTNSLGFRGKEYSMKKTPDTIRIVFLGDSFTFGEGVKDNDIFSKRLVELLNEKYKTRRNLHFEGYNFGVGGYNTEQSLFLLKNLVLKADPDIVILGYTLNDAEPKLFYIDRETQSIKRMPREKNINEGLAYSKPPETLLYKLRSVRLIWQFLKNNKLKRETIDYYNSLYNEGNPDWNITKESLKKIINICDDNRIDCYIVCFPLLYELNDNYPFRHIHKLIKDIVTSVGSDHVDFIDLFPYFKGQKDTELWVHPTDQHPNEIAHKIVAGAIFNYINRERVLPD